MLVMSFGEVFGDGVRDVLEAGMVTVNIVE